MVNFTVEAEQSLKEVSYAIQDGSMSSTLSSSGEVAYFNLTTREGSKFTVRLCMRGFQVSLSVKIPIMCSGGILSPVIEVHYGLKIILISHNEIQLQY